MRHSSAIPVFAAIASLAFGVALYYIFLSANPASSAPETPPRAGQTQAGPAQGELAGKKPFSFNAYPEPRNLPELP